MSKKSVPCKGKSPSVPAVDARMGRGFRNSHGSGGNAKPYGCDKTKKRKYS